MKRRSALLLVVTALVLSATAPDAVMATDPAPDGSITTDDGRVLPPMPEELVHPSVHAEMLAQEGSASVSFAPGGAPAIVLGKDGSPQYVSGADGPDAGLAPATSALPGGLRKEVLGFLPYWMLTDTALASMNYSLVSTIAYFSVGLQQDGYLTKGTSSGWSGWNSSRMTQVIDRAHSVGARVVLTVTMMSWSSTTNQSTFLNSATYRARAVSQIVDAVRSRSADGVNLDFEPVPSSLRSQYTSWVRQLKKGLTDAGVGSYLTVDVTAGAATWATGYDVAGLTASGAADHLFVMGYDYHWSGSARAGGVAPIDSPYTVDVDGTMRDFLSQAPGSKIIWGVPYYGRTWPTSSSQLNATTLGGGSKAYYYTGHLSQSGQYGRRWDDVGKVPWYRYWDAAAGHWVQGYYDDVASLGVKYDLVNARGFAGTGMWTLLMDQGRDELWRLLADRFVTDTAPPVGGITLLPASVDSLAVPVSWRAVDYASGVDRYNVQARRLGGSWSTWLANTKATSGWYPAVAGTAYEFRVQAIDYKGNAQPWISVPGSTSSVSSGAFVRVSTATLNVRSGPGTSYASVAQVASGDAAYVLEGPVAASGYDWYRVQYGFSEWPSADYPLIGWVAAGSASDPFIVPAAAPTTVTADPFVTALDGPAEFFPNGDGKADSARITFRLKAAAAGGTLELLNASGAVVRSIPLGARGAGEHAVTWDGKTAAGAWVPEGHYLPRVTVTDTGGSKHGAPALSFGAGQFGRWGIHARKSPFNDIGASAFRGDIEWLFAAGITGGCTATRFCPSSGVSREQMASFLARALDLPPALRDYFGDDAASPHEADINRLAQAGISRGCGPGRFCPEAQVSRAQMAAFLVRSLRLSAGATANLFDDDNGHPHEAEINKLATAGISSGCATRRFCPDATVTREQMAAFLHRAFGP